MRQGSAQHGMVFIVAGRDRFGQGWSMYGWARRGGPRLDAARYGMVFIVAWRGKASYGGASSGRASQGKSRCLLGQVWAWSGAAGCGMAMQGVCRGMVWLVMSRLGKAL